MQVLGTAPGRSELHITQGDDLALTVTNGGQQVPAPVTLWWPDGTLTAGVPDTDGVTVGVVLPAAEVDRLIAATADTARPVAQLDVGTVRTVLLDVVAHRTPRPEAASIII